MQKALFLPELDCSFVSIQKDNCFDKFKIMNLSSYLSDPENEDFLIDYFHIFGFSEIKIYQVYPVNSTFSYTLYKNIPKDYSSIISTQSPVLLFDTISKRYDCGIIEVVA